MTIFFMIYLNLSLMAFLCACINAFIRKEYIWLSVKIVIIINIIALLTLTYIRLFEGLQF